MGFSEDISSIAEPRCERSRAGRRSPQRIGGGSSVWVCFLLAVLGFGGGLSLASFSFNSPESSTQISGVAPELLYLRPQAPPGSVAGSASGHSETVERAVDGSAIALLADLQLARPETYDVEQSALVSISASDSLARLGSPDGLSFKGTGLSHAPGSFEAGGNPPIALASDGAFAGVVLPVPEPSSWAMMASGAGILLAAMRGRRKGKR